MKVKHLIKKLSEMDPEANVYFGAMGDSKPADYLLLGTRLKREGYFMLTTAVEHYDNSVGPTDRSLVDHIINRYGTKSRDDLHGKDILISNWDGKWE